MDLLWSLGWFVAGTIFGLLISRAFVAILPGPSMTLSIDGRKPPAGTNAERCIVYMLAFKGRGEIEHMLARLWFPNTVEDLKVGFPQEAATPSGVSGGLGLAVGRTADGKCQVKIGIDSGDVQVSTAGNRVTIQSSRLRDRQRLFGVVATSTTASFFSDATSKMEGYYEYVKLGQIVRKPLPITFTGIKPL